MDAFAHQVAERGIDEPLAVDAGLAGEGRAFDQQREMAFAGRVVAAVAAVLLALVDKLDPGRAKRRIEPRKHFGCDGAGALRVHRSYIGAFYGIASVENARAGRRGTGAMRSSRLRLARRV